MSTYYCPNCDQPLPTEAINIGEGVALCGSCQRLTRLSELIEHEQPNEAVIGDPPGGCRIVNEVDGVSIHLSLRSIGGLIGGLFICLFWNGILSVFLLVFAAGIYNELIGPIPEWFPAPEFDESMGLGMTIFLGLFLTPFIVIGVGMIGMVLMSAMGSMRIRIGRDQGRVSTGIGPIAWTKRFNPRAVTGVSVGRTKWKENDQHKPLVVIEAEKDVRFGSGLSNRKRMWLVAVLRRELLSNRETSRR